MYRVTIYYMAGGTKVYERVSNARALALENLAFTDKRIASVTSERIGD